MRPTTLIGLGGLLVIGVVIGYALRAPNTQAVLRTGSQTWLGSLREITGGN